MKTFDQNQTLSDDEGNVIRFILDPLDEQYIVEPNLSLCPSGMLPPEELVMRKMIFEMKVAREKYFEFGIWSKLFSRNKVKKHNDMANEKERDLYNFVHISDVHLAALKRIISVTYDSRGKQVLTRFLRIDSMGRV